MSEKAYENGYAAQAPGSAYHDRDVFGHEEGHQVNRRLSF